jgi:hypothetical protein
MTLGPSRVRHLVVGATARPGHYPNPGQIQLFVRGTAYALIYMSKAPGHCKSLAGRRVDRRPGSSGVPEPPNTPPPENRIARSLSMSAQTSERPPRSERT